MKTTAITNFHLQYQVALATLNVGRYYQASQPGTRCHTTLHCLEFQRHTGAVPHNITPDAPYPGLCTTKSRCTEKRGPGGKQPKTGAAYVISGCKGGTAEARILRISISDVLVVG